MNPAVKKGDVIFADRGLYRHYGVYNGEKSVIHFSPDRGTEISPENAYIHETTLVEFLKGGELRVDRTIQPVFPPEEIVRRALSLVNTSQGDYNLLTFNCEHFAAWCAAGKLESAQVNDGAAAVETLAETASALVTKAVVNRNRRGISKKGE